MLKTRCYDCHQIKMCCQSSDLGWICRGCYKAYYPDNKELKKFVKELKNGSSKPPTTLR